MRFWLPQTRQWRMIATSIVTSVCFFAVTVWFHIADPYTTLFFSQDTPKLLLHIAFRSIFLIFFLEILFAAGQGILYIVKDSPRALSLECGEEVAISLLCGSALVRVLMLVLGFAGFYSWWVIAPIGTILAGLGWPSFSRLCRHWVESFKPIWRESAIERLSWAGLAICLVIAFSVVFIEKFLFPNGTGDYFSHYFPYFREVIAVGNIRPNSVWYHFYISKADGDIFFSIILTDLLGSQTVSCAMFVTALLIMFCFVRRLTGDGLVALAAATATAIGFIWTFETTIGFQYWAEFPKEHMIESVLFLGCVWAAWRQYQIVEAAPWRWATLVSIAFGGLILLRVQFAILALLFLGLMAGFAWVTAKRTNAISFMIPAITVVTIAGAILYINYRLTGLAEITPFRLFWRVADQARFARWVSPFLMLLLDLGSSRDLGSIALPNLHQFPFLSLFSAVFRLDRARFLIGPWGSTALVALALAIFGALNNGSDARLGKAMRGGVVLLLMLAAAIATFFSVNQIGSLYRVYMFCMFPVVALASLPFALARLTVSRRLRTLIGLFLTAQLLIYLPIEINNIPPEMSKPEEQFALAKMNMAGAFAGQNAVWPAALEMSKIAGEGKAIWSSNVGYHFCIAPQCNFETFFSFSMGKEWATIMFGPAGAAQAALQRIGINYFAIDTTVPFFDILPYSPLFSPSEIANHFGELWAKDGVHLLTWRSSATRPLPENFVDKYEHSMRSAIRLADFPALYRILADVYRTWKTNKKFPVQIDPNIARPRGWQ